MTAPSHTTWELSTDPFTIQDLEDARILQKGPGDNQFVESITRLLRHRVIDPPELSASEVMALTLEDVAYVGQRVLHSMRERMSFDQSMSSIRRMVDDAHRTP
jgi:hypothetical protein